MKISKIIIDETDAMMEAFMTKFFLPYMEDHLEKLDVKDSAANILISFIQSAYVTIANPIISSFPTDKQKLRQIRQMLDVLGNNLYHKNKVELNKKKLN